MNELPSGWVETRLDDCAVFNPKHPADADRSTEVSFVPMPAVSESTGTVEAQEVRRLSEIWTGYTHFRNGDVIFAKITPCMENGKIAVARDLHNGLACGSTEFHVLRPHDGVLADYLWRYLRQNTFRRDAEQSMTGAVGQRRVPANFLRNTVLPLPPSGEQQRIVAKIDSLTAKSKRAREQLTHASRLVEKYRRAVLKAAFRGELTAKWRKDNPSSKAVDLLPTRARMRAERATRKQKPKGYANAEGVAFPVLPQEWAYRSIQELYEAGWIVDYADGNHGSLYPTKADFSNDGILFITATQITNGRVDFVNASRLRRGKAAELKKGWSRQGDILLTHNATVGGVAIVDEKVEDFLLGTSVTFYRVDQEVICPSFLCFALQSPIFQGQLASTMVQTTRNQVPITTQALLRLPIPMDIAEQQEIALRLGAAFRWINRLGSEATSARKLIDHLDQAVLAKAFRGGLVPQDQNDEPASALLERIRAAGQAAFRPLGGGKKRKATRA